MSNYNFSGKCFFFQLYAIFACSVTIVARTPTSNKIMIINSVINTHRDRGCMGKAIRSSKRALAQVGGCSIIFFPISAVRKRTVFITPNRMKTDVRTSVFGFFPHTPTRIV